MPANLPPPYLKAEARFRAATTTEEKVAALEEMLRIIPKHKGTDKLQADLKARLAKLRRQPRKKGGARTASHVIPREGAGQIVLLGPPNSGKSALVGALTHAEPVVAEYPFTTREAQPGMMPYRDVAFQLIDMPPLSREHVDPWIYDLVRRADLLWLVVESGSPLEGWELVRGMLEEKKILVHPPEDGPPEGIDLDTVPKPALLVVTACDKPGGPENVHAFRELLEEEWPVVTTSTADHAGLEELKERTFAALDIIRVYTKEPHKPPDFEQPFTLPRGSTVEDLALKIHRDLSAQFKFARLWGKSVFDGQRVQRDHVLEEGDVVELHI
jgi:ribosome-interacting GTPase 1